MNPTSRGLGHVTLVLVMAVSWADPSAAQVVTESARGIPIAYDVDVVVVGGSTGAVSAALSAAEAGASVFLAAPHPYLGEDMTATLRLWLEEGEEPRTPLAKRLFTDEVRYSGGPDPNRMDFTYEASLSSAAMHPDTSPPRVLADGKWGNPASQSVQYDGDVSITADLGEIREIEEVRLVVYYRGPGDTSFIVASLAVSISDDGQMWKEVESIENRSAEGQAVLSVPVAGSARYVRLDVKKADDAQRILLGEVEIVRPAPDEPPAEPPRYPPPRPMHVKKTLDEVLLEAKIPFLYSCFVIDVLRDDSGNPCGVVMANRAGRQAVIAKTIIDATDRATVARLAGAKSRPYPPGKHTIKRVVIGGEVLSTAGLTARVIDPPFQGPHPNPAGTSSGQFQVIEYTMELPMEDGSWSSFAKADQLARTMTYHPEQQFTSDRLFQVPPDPIHGREHAGGQLPVGLLPMDAFRPEGIPSMYVLGGCADIPRSKADGLMRPLALIDLGTRIGMAAAKDARSRPDPSGVHVQGEPVAQPAAKGDVGEVLIGVRPIQELDTVPQAARSIPVLARYDVVVIGGGTGGAPAGIGAGRRGAKTLVVEHLHGLGGVGTIGAISKYYWGNRVGFTATIDGGASWVIEQKKEWYRTQLLDAGADIWFGSIGCGAFVDEGQVKGAVVATPQGRGVVLADVVIDTTGNSDIAVAAGADCYYTDASEFAMQGTGLPHRRLGTTYTNTDFTIADETDLVDMWHLFVYAKNKYADAFDQGSLIDTRERRRIVGDFTMTILDQVLERKYPDTIEVAFSNFDTHGYTIDPYLELEHPGKQGYEIHLPYRCLLPKGMDGILVGGLGVSAHRDAVPMIRMQPDIQNQGYAAGVAAAMASQANVPLRKIDIRALQKHLIEVGNLPESVLSDADSFPLPAERVAAAVATVKDEFEGVAVILAQPDIAVPLLRQAYAGAEGEDKVTYAHVLAVLGDATGLPTLMDEVQQTEEWDEGWNYRGMGQFGRALSRLDQLIVAMGRTRDPRALPTITKKAALLTTESEFSHHRAVALAYELIGKPDAAKPLSEILTQPGMTGYVHATVEDAIRRDQESPGGTNAVQTRRESLRELLHARALYRCGDYGIIGKQILQQYTKDLRGHLARHAKAVLESEGID